MPGRLSIREIARCTELLRNTVAKHLAADTVEPRFATTERPSKLAAFAERLTGWLQAEAGKSRKQRQTLKQMHADPVTLGVTDSYGRVAAFARQWRADRQREQPTTGRGTFVPLPFRPGEAFQSDLSEDFAVLSGKRTKLQMVNIELSRSRAFLLRAYPACRPTRCSSMPPGPGSGSSAACRRVGSMTVRRWPPWVRGHAERAPR